MKTLAVLLISILTTISTFASIVEPIETTVEGKNITVYFDQGKSETIAIKIVDKYGFELHSEKVETKNRKSRNYNLEQLPFGVYTLAMESDQKIVYKKIKIDHRNSTVLSEKISYKPTTFFENNKWKINLLSLGSDVSIKIFDAEYELIFEEKFLNEMVLAKAYDLSKLEYGVYTLVVDTDDKSYSKVIAKM